MSELVARLRRMQSLTIVGGSLAGEAADEIESLRQQLADAQQQAELGKAFTGQFFLDIERLEQKLADSQQALRNVYEVWDGSEGIFNPESSTETYLMTLVAKMRDAAKDGMK